MAAQYPTPTFTVQGQGTITGTYSQTYHHNQGDPVPGEPHTTWATTMTFDEYTVTAAPAPGWRFSHFKVDSRSHGYYYSSASVLDGVPSLSDRIDYDVNTATEGLSWTLNGNPASLEVATVYRAYGSVMLRGVPGVETEDFYGLTRLYMAYDTVTVVAVFVLDGEYLLYDPNQTGQLLYDPYTGQLLYNG